jgi:hypothetical protein
VSASALHDVGGRVTALPVCFNETTVAPPRKAKHLHYLRLKPIEVPPSSAPGRAADARYSLLLLAVRPASSPEIRKSPVLSAPADRVGNLRSAARALPLTR